MKNHIAAIILSATTALPATAAGPEAFHTHHDTIPNFARNHTIESVRNGEWTDAAAWNPARVPAPGDVVAVSHDVLYNATAGDVDTVGIVGGGRLRFATDRNTSLRAANVLVMPGGALEIGTPDQPVPAACTADLIIKNKPLDLSADAGQFGTGLVSVDGVVIIHGAAKTPTFVRLAQAPRTGDTAFLLESPVTGWRAGDKIALPDSTQKLTESGSGVPTSVNQEEVIVQNISGDGRTITFTPALAFDHPGTSDENGDGKPDYLPHVACLPRNVTIRSESRTGTRGHVLFTGKSRIDVRHAAFVNLGRTTFFDLDPVTNRIGRYSLHFHHVSGPYPPVDPEHQFRVVGNSIYEDAAETPPQKWGITVHGSHYGLIKDNVVYNVGGAGIVTEDGSESFNVFDHNFVMRITGNGGRDEHADATRGIAREGAGFWFRGTNNYVRNNVAVNMIESGPDRQIESAYGFKFNMVYLGNVRVPNFPGADIHMGTDFTTVHGNALPLLEFSGNETYGQIQGITIWWLGTVDLHARTETPVSILKDTVIWHVSRYAYYGYPAYNQVFDGLKVYGDQSMILNPNQRFEFHSRFWFSDYMTEDFVIRNAAFYDTHGLWGPYFRDGTIRVENSFFRTKNGYLHQKSNAHGSCPACDLPDGDTILSGNVFVPLQGQNMKAVSLNTNATDPANNDRLVLCRHQGVPGDSFEVFFPSQGNAPCTNTRPGVDGYACVTAFSAASCNDLPPSIPARPRRLRPR